MSLKNYIPKTKPALWKQLKRYSDAPPLPKGHYSGFEAFNRSKSRKVVKTPVRARKPIRRVSPQKAKRDRVYNARVKVWLTEPGKDWCHCCHARFPEQTPKRSTNCHHYFGRGHRNQFLMIEAWWIPCCTECHPAWIHNNIQAAREIGMYAPKGQYNNPPKHLLRVALITELTK